MSSWCALFDWDGVIIDSSALHQKSWERLAAKENRTLPEGYFKKAFGMKNDRIIPEILGWAKESDVVAMLAKQKEENYRQLIVEEGIHALPGVEWFLNELQAAGIPAIVASSSSRLNIESAIDRIGLRPYFQDIVSGDQVPHGKPDPGIFLLACRTLGYPAHKAIVFEDALVGIEAARAAEMKVVGVTTTHPREKLRHADWVVDRLDELSLDHLNAWFADMEFAG
jgi:beta-phosphoglucomutase family hydrolase